MAFGYFENLFYLRDVLKVQQELARIKSLSQLLQQVGQQEHLYEIFVDATEEVFNQIIQSIQQGVPDESFLVDAFNAEYNSNAIITHFRVRAFFSYRILSIHELMQAALNKRLDQAQPPPIPGLLAHADRSVLRDAR